MRLAQTLWIFFTHIHHAIMLSWTVAWWATDHPKMSLPKTTLYELMAMHFGAKAGWKFQQVAADTPADTHEGNDAGR